MNRPWQIWTLFAACLSATAGAMAWLTLQAVELDRAESLARRQAALEETVNLSLWRMDTVLIPLLAREAARPPQAFQPFAHAQLKAATAAQNPSPLLRAVPDLVLLHFQTGPGNVWTSPQTPTGDARNLATQWGLSMETLGRRDALLCSLQQAVDFETLLRETPSDMLPPLDAEPLAGSEAGFGQAGAVVAGNYGYAQLPSQSEGSQPNAGEFAAVENQASQNQASQNPRQAYQSRSQGAGDERGQNDLNLRNRALQNFAGQQVFEQRANSGLEAPQSPAIREGVCRAFWVGDKLLLARRVQAGAETLVQGCWLDWPAIEARLRAETADLLPQMEVVPIRNEAEAGAGRGLATLPVAIQAPALAAETPGWTPLRLALAFAWSCLTTAALAITALLWGTLALSERRAAFVAAVTHELRTPLTTFRLYSEMLAQGMAPIEKRQQYLETMQTEADRLMHLVENVLSYARLERHRGVGRRTTIQMTDLLASWTPRLEDRAAQAGLELVVAIDESAKAAAVCTDPQAVGQILFNLVDNAAKYASGGAEPRVEITSQAAGKWVSIRVRDYGPGLTAAERRRLFRPFSKSVQEAAVTAPGVGLGLALCRRLARDLGGRLRCDDVAGDGTCFVLELPLAALSCEPAHSAPAAQPHREQPVA